MLTINGIKEGSRFIDQNGLTEVVEVWRHKEKTLYKLYQMEYDNELTIDGDRLAKLLQFATVG